MAIDIIHQRQVIFDRLNSLSKDATPKFGKMTPQHMVEHLVLSVSISNSKGPQKQYLTPEEGEVIKGKLIYTDVEIPTGIKNPILGDELAALKFQDLNSAIAQLKIELEEFDRYFEINPEGKTTQPRMGLLDHKEWTILHNKHIAHHLKQFELI